MPKKLKKSVRKPTKPKKVIKKAKPVKVKKDVVSARETKPTPNMLIPETKETQEQKAGIPAVINSNSFEGVKRIDHLPLKDQMNQIFNPMQAITRTDVRDTPSDATFVVEKKADPKG